MTDQAVYKSEYLSNTALWSAIREYNDYPIRSIHPSWLNSLQHHKLVGKLAACKRNHKSLSRYVFQCLNITQTPDYEFPVKEKRLLLLTSDVLQQIVLLAGITLHRSTLSQLIDGASIRKIRSTIGDNNYIFAIKKAPFFVANLPRFKQAQSLNVKQNENDLRNQLEQAGIELLASALEQMQHNNIQRLLLKLPQHWGKMLLNTKTRAQPAGVQKASLDILTRLTRETTPACHHLFV